MRLKLIPNAKKVALRSYSMWSIYLGILSMLLSELIAYLTSYSELDPELLLKLDRVADPQIWWLLGMALLLFGAFGRLVLQETVRSPFAVVLVAMSMITASPPTEAQSEKFSSRYTLEEFDAWAIPLTSKWEGLRTTAYLDTIAVPPVWTVCYGETKGVKKGDTYTKAECDAMLARELREYRAELHRYFTDVTLQNRLTAPRDASYTDLSYNAGTRAIGGSTAVRRLNNGDIAGGCEAMGWWNKAGKRVVRGLVNRRAENVALCMAGLK